MELFIDEVVRAVEPFLPLAIHDVSEIVRCSLTIGGEDWSLNINSPWRITRAGRLLIGSDEGEAPPWPADLATQRIVAVVPQGVGALDLAFVLDGGEVLEVFSCHPDEPWVLCLPSGSVWASSPSVTTGAV
jgi:hypothetical protein